MNPIKTFFSGCFVVKQASQLLSTVALAAALISLTACGGGASTEANPDTSASDGISIGIANYGGPNPANDDVRDFRIYVWDRLREPNKCVACHTENNQSPMFVRQDDVNQAYDAAVALIDLDSPASSRLVTKVAGGHNCWLSSNAACATAITGYIEDWAAGSNEDGRQIQLVAPTEYDPGATLSFPMDVSLTNFETTVWPVLTDNCSGCHVDTSATAQAPFFASTDVNDAYDAAKSKINLNDPLLSRFVVRLREEFHNCWTDCSSDSTEMQDAIVAMAGSIIVNPVAAPTVFSKALTLPEGIVAAGGNRYEADVIALYEFKTGSGATAIDSSGVYPDLDLDLSGNYAWIGGWGIQIIDGKAQGSTAESKKLYDWITATGEYSIEAWIAPGNVVQEGPARIVSYSAGTMARNFTLGQTQYNYDFLHRSSTTDENGEAALSTADADEDLQATLQHVVVTFDPVNGRRIYVNGEYTDDVDPVAPGNLNDWDDSYAFVLGNEASGDRLWQGAIRMVAIHKRALTQEQVTQNFEVGVGEKFYLLFAIGDIVNLPQSYIMFEVAQYDSYSYLFNKPTFINLDSSVMPGTIPIKRMSIGINGNEATVGQAFRALDTTINDAAYDPATGQVLSDLGTIIPLEAGPQGDEFFLTFEVLGGQSNVVTENSPLTPPSLPAPAEASDIGLRTFDEINASMAAVTGVDPQLIRAEFEVLRQQLPSVETINGFLSAHQMAIAQLSIAYCDALVEDGGSVRSGFFLNSISSGFDFNADVYSAFSGGKQVDVIDDIYDKVIGIPGISAFDLTRMPSRAEVQLELNNSIDGDGDAVGDGLYDRLRNSCPDPAPVPVPASCDATRTKAIIKAMCASSLGSAAMLVQ